MLLECNTAFSIFNEVVFLALNTETKLESIQSSLSALKAVQDPAVQAEAEKLEKNVREIISINKPMVVNYAEQLKNFDAGIVAKYGVPTARVIEFALVAFVAAKMWLVG